MQRLNPHLSLLTLIALVPTTADAQWSTDSLSLARTKAASTTVDGLALFAGGRDGASVFDRVDVYDAALGSWSTAALSVPRGELAAASVGQLALFAGGFAAPFAASDVVDVYDASKGSPQEPGAWSTATLSQARGALAAASVGDKVLFAGGELPGSLFDTVDIYDSSKGSPEEPGAWSTATLSEPRANLCAVSVGDRVLFAGGSGVQGVTYDDVDIYDDSTGLWSTATLSVARVLGATGAAAAGSRAYFGGGHNSFQGGPGMFDAVDVYDAATGLWTTATLSSARGYVAVTSVGSTVLFAGGVETNFVHSSDVDALDTATSQWASGGSLSEARGYMGAASVGGQALFAGGTSANGSSAVVDVYELCSGGVPASELVRLGSPPNPDALLPGVTSGPVIGATWDPVIDHASFAPGSVLDTLGLAFGPANLPLDGFGTLLCDFFSTPLLLFNAPAPGVPFGLALPSDCNLVGASLCVQGISYDGEAFQLTNALDATIGSY